MDSDGDNVGDNSDVFPNDANESMDSDGDGVGNNADAFPADANETMDSDGDGVGDNAQAVAEAAAAKQKEEDEKRRNMIIIAVVAIIVIGIGATLFLRSRNTESAPSKDYDQLSQPNPVAVNQQVSPPVSQLQIINQWTDESGYTWRKMSDDSHHYWDGAQWVKHG